MRPEMNTRLLLEEIEMATLSPLAAKSALSAGRGFFEEKCESRTDFQRDRDRITHCKAFRRLNHKTQVFISHEGDHYRTRLTHTLEVAQVARALARCLRLNEDLAEAIALGHDLGHTPFGHIGERALNEAMPMGFRHNEQSLRVVEKIEKLNLTKETLDGMLNHRSSGKPATLEGQCVRLADKIAYINHDIDDAIRAGALSAEKLPKWPVEVLGATGRERIGFLVASAVEESYGKRAVALPAEAEQAMGELRNFLFENVYDGELQRDERAKTRRLVIELYAECLSKRSLPPECICEGVEIERAAGDFVAGMTDRYALRAYSEMVMPVSWRW
jgi:dGTPase